MSLQSCSFLLSIFLSFILNSSGWDLSWRNCGPGTDSVQLKSLQLNPDPVQVPGTLSITGSVDITSQTPTDIQVALLVERKVGPFFVKVPCVDNFGSCTYNNACALWAEYCPKYAAKYGLPCQCPIPANTYSVSDASVSINVNLPPELLGEYRATADIRSGEGHLGCVIIDLTIRK